MAYVEIHVMFKFYAADQCDTMILDRQKQICSLTLGSEI
jgi:hypothetical protein